MRVRLTRKLAECIDGVDLSRSRTGDILDLSPQQARLLISEQWAVPVAGPSETRHATVASARAVAADSATRRTTEQLHRVREQMERHRFEEQQSRRMEDRIRDELHDARARIIAAHPDSMPPGGDRRGSTDADDNS
jgi:hypothetical protein